MKITKTEERITKTGKPYLYVEINGGEGKENKLSCFQDFSWCWGMIKGAEKSGEEVALSIIDSKGFRNIAGIEGIQAPVKPSGKSSAINEAMTRKEAGIKKATERKENSMSQFACRRDAAMFASSIKSKDELIEDYKFWAEYFKKVYGIEE